MLVLLRRSFTRSMKTSGDEIADALIEEERLAFLSPIALEQDSMHASCARVHASSDRGDHWLPHHAPWQSPCDGYPQEGR